MTEPEPIWARLPIFHGRLQRGVGADEGVAAIVVKPSYLQVEEVSAGLSARVRLEGPRVSSSRVG